MRELTSEKPFDSLMHGLKPVNAIIWIFLLRTAVALNYFTRIISKWLLLTESFHSRIKTLLGNSGKRGQIAIRCDEIITVYSDVKVL